MKEVTIGAHNLKGHLFSAGEADVKHPAILFLHGWTSRQDRMFPFAETLARQGYTCLTFDMRGHGATGGDLNVLSRKDFLDDAIAAYDFLAAQEGVDATRITAIGSSFGGYLTALLTAARPVHAACLRVPADYRDEDFDVPLIEAKQRDGAFEWKQTPHEAAETKALNAIHAFGGRVLIVESEKDDIVPGPTVQSYGVAAKPEHLTYVVMKNAPHTIHRFPELQKEYEAIVTHWLTGV